MVPSRYLVTLPHPSRPGWSALFSTRTASLCLVPDEVAARLGRGEVPPDLADRLAALGAAVPALGAERAAALGFVDEVNRVDPGVTAAVILGMACNFACPYCYEAGIRDRGPGVKGMAPGTIEALAAFLDARLTPGKTQLLLDLYGGETLLYVPAIRRLAERLRPLCAERGVSLRLQLVTNGSLLTPEVVDELLPLGLAGARVTLDGPAEIHGRSRPFRDGRGSFETILSNLKAVADRVKVSVGSNYTEETWRDYPRLLDRLAAEGLTPPRLGLVHFAPVLRMREAGCGGCASANEPWAAEAAVTLREEVLRRGYRTARLSPSPCMIDRDDAFTVDWDGTLYKCPGLVGRREFAAGDLWQGFAEGGEAASRPGGRSYRNYRESHGVQAWRRDPRCRDCTYLPLCFGGCRFQRLQAEGSLVGVDCRRAFLDATLEHLLRQELRYRHGAS